MTRYEIIRRAFEVFGADAGAAPPLTLRGGNAVDSYDIAEPFDAARDEPTDAYLEGFAFWGLGYLDARSWRHYLPRLIAYAFRRPDDPAMVVEALIHTLRPPDRYPPRLRTLTAEQESVIVAFLEEIACADDFDERRDDAHLALEEWWRPGAQHRTPAPPAHGDPRFRRVNRARYSLELPETFTSSGARDIPTESRTVEVWRGVVAGEIPVVVAVNITPVDDRHLRQIVDRAARGLRAASIQTRDASVTGARGACRVDGLTHGDSPDEPQPITIVAARARDIVVTLSVRSWPRADVNAVVDRVVRSFVLTPAGS